METKNLHDYLVRQEQLAFKFLYLALGYYVFSEAA